MQVYKAVVIHKFTQIKQVMSVTAKNITDLKRRLNLRNYELKEVIE
jgi:hypothetical protein